MTDTLREWLNLGDLSDWATKTKRDLLSFFKPSLNILSSLLLLLGELFLMEWEIMFGLESNVTLRGDNKPFLYTYLIYGDYLGLFYSVCLLNISTVENSIVFGLNDFTYALYIYCTYCDLIPCSFSIFFHAYDILDFVLMSLSYDWL